MEQSTEIINAIGSVGFPIVASCGLFWMLNTILKEVNATMAELTTAINKLITIITEEKDNE